MQKHAEQIHEEEWERVKEVSICITQNNITDLVSQVTAAKTKQGSALRNAMQLGHVVIKYMYIYSHISYKREKN